MIDSHFFLSIFKSSSCLFSSISSDYLLDELGKKSRGKREEELTFAEVKAFALLFGDKGEQIGILLNQGGHGASVRCRCRQGGRGR